MAENSLLDRGSDALRSSSKACEMDNMGSQKISVSDQTDRLQCTNLNSDSFTVDMERLSLLTHKDITSNPKLTRSPSRKVSQQKSIEKKINLSIGNENDTSVVGSTSSPRGVLAGYSTSEKPMVVTVGTSTKDQPISPNVHHQITIMTGNMGTRTAGERRRSDGKRFSFRRSSSSWGYDPRRIPLFFATLSSMGTILLIYFTLSIGKQNGNESDALKY